MEFKINDKVMELATGDECIIAATKEETVLTSQGLELKVSEGYDYLLYIKVSEDNYEGTMDVYEHQLKRI